MVKSNFLALDLEIRALNLLITSMSSLLCQYATTLEEDEALLLSDGQNVGGESCKTMKMVLIYRVTQKRILLKTSTKLKYLTTVLKSLDQNQVSRTLLAAVLA